MISMLKYLERLIPMSTLAFETAKIWEVGGLRGELINRYMTIANRVKF